MDLIVVIIVKLINEFLSVNARCTSVKT